jgi:hypothetical protein
MEVESGMANDRNPAVEMDVLRGCLGSRIKTPKTATLEQGEIST